ncbi:MULTISPECIES: 3-isopropylmalate dehydratase small subunit [unclassified Pseudomonas]|uniref:3-isopropylmalate dehydratase small subunit n=1 Tax=unclassified Pseudomonas TaxID=196821 RepID=UPI0024498F60|nr:MULTISPECIES: 3-isopropylmalate dehydratase small subunit [unclassified Pseudomonas]MDG9930420.1 3-isopropylmalate dehydratase small subunit [Pseudomonas sp. GD04042]MDH0483030.1 3-isopropylmalate dehydratase small subunit [Pseudomonas sp. GD04015]MDH0605430.1 3-isopropylmalate dehydratase small subunit [Pseudomonas sp. GD03869]
MQPLIEHEGVVIPLNRANIDTDMLLPKQYLKSLESHGFGGFLFDDERYLDPGEIDTPPASRRENPAFILNREPYRHGSLVLAQANFGCGSSREHAVWALRDFGVRVVIAPSFGDIFRSNCFNNGMLPLILPQEDVDRLFAMSEARGELRARVDVARRTLEAGDRRWVFELEEGRRQRLLKGLDDIGETLRHAERIRAYEAERQRLEPWVFRS